MGGRSMSGFVWSRPYYGVQHCPPGGIAKADRWVSVSAVGDWAALTTYEWTADRKHLNHTTTHHDSPHAARLAGEAWLRSRVQQTHNQE